LGRNSVAVGRFVWVNRAHAGAAAGTEIPAVTHAKHPMRSENRNSSIEPLICRKAAAGEGVDHSAMPRRSADPADAMLCPACARPMAHVRTIWRAFLDDLQVFECRACNVSVTVRVPET
jgi:hypothetical protein